jgi:hypothetical protein
LSRFWLIFSNAIPLQTHAPSTKEENGRRQEEKMLIPMEQYIAAGNQLYRNPSKEILAPLARPSPVPFSVVIVNTSRYIKIIKFFIFLSFIT